MEVLLLLIQMTHTTFSQCAHFIMHSKTLLEGLSSSIEEGKGRCNFWRIWFERSGCESNDVAGTLVVFWRPILALMA